MKKIVALFLSLMMLAGCAALAETAEKETLTMQGAFDIKYSKLPDYYTMDVKTDTEMEFTARIHSEDASKPTLDLIVCFNDEWYGVDSLAQATEEDLQAVQQDFYDVMELDDGDLTFTDGQTGLGTPLMIVKEKEGAFAAVYSIYLSHEIEVDIFPHDEGGTVTDADVDAVIAFLTDVEFVPVEK
jgi:uncharacterized protein YcfL